MLADSMCAPRHDPQPLETGDLDLRTQYARPQSCTIGAAPMQALLFVSSQSHDAYCRHRDPLQYRL
jgi:hypothetical protein